MRLNCSKNNEISIYALWEKLRCFAGENPEDVIRKEPKIACELRKANGLLCQYSISRSSWEKLLKEFFLTELAGPHANLKKIFAPAAGGKREQCSFGKHILTSVAGTGTSGCTCRTADGYCLKIVDSSKIEKLKAEYEILKELRHENIVRCYEFFCEADCAALLLEPLRVVPGDGKDYLAALEYCHARGILHGDIRLNNLGVCSEGKGKLFDFGNAVRSNSKAAMQKEINTLKALMASPIALERKIPIPAGGALC